MIVHIINLIAIWQMICYIQQLNDLGLSLNLGIDSRTRDVAPAWAKGRDG